MSRQWAIVRFASADAADSANTRSLSVSGPPGVSMVLALQPAADAIVRVPRHHHHHNRKEEGEGEEQGTMIPLSVVGVEVESTNMEVVSRWAGWRTTRLVFSLGKCVPGKRFAERLTLRSDQPVL